MQSAQNLVAIELEPPVHDLVPVQGESRAWKMALGMDGPDTI